MPTFWKEGRIEFMRFMTDGEWSVVNEKGFRSGDVVGLSFCIMFVLHPSLPPSSCDFMRFMVDGEWSVVNEKGFRSGDVVRALLPSLPPSLPLFIQAHLRTHPPTHPSTLPPSLPPSRNKAAWAPAGFSRPWQWWQNEMT